MVAQTDLVELLSKIFGSFLCTISTSRTSVSRGRLGFLFFLGKTVDCFTEPATIFRVVVVRLQEKILGLSGSSLLVEIMSAALK